MKEVLRLSNQVVADHTTKGLNEALVRAERARHGEGCTCLGCKKAAMSEVNSWIGWVSDGDPTSYFYSLNDKGDLVQNMSKVKVYKKP